MYIQIYIKCKSQVASTNKRLVLQYHDRKVAVYEEDHGASGWDDVSDSHLVQLFIPHLTAECVH